MIEVCVGCFQSFQHVRSGGHHFCVRQILFGRNARRAIDVRQLATISGEDFEERSNFPRTERVKIS
jgi:hypothetical protein